MSTQSVRGKAGEDFVCGNLKAAGWTVEARNYRIKGGEIDIVARKAGTLAFVEVKTRKANSLTEGIDAVDRRKRSCIIRTADRYIQEHPSDADTVRFDVALVTVTSEEVPRVISMEYLDNAFDSFSVLNVYEHY
jgi:putative endonuclease